MPSESLKSILDPEIAIEMHREDIEIVSPLLDEIVNNSTYVFQRCQHSAQGSVDEDIPILMIYLQMIEMADGVRVLLSQSCSVASTPLVRSLFESILSVKYILEQESEFQKRSYALLVNSIHNQLAKYQTLDSSTQRGQEFINAASSDLHMCGLAQSVSSNQTIIQNAITTYQSRLQKPHLNPFENKYQNLRSQKQFRYWPQLADGPNNRRELAKKLNMLPYYDILYPYWSGTSHGEDLSYRLTTTDGEHSFHPLRSSGSISLKECASYTATFMLEATQLMLKKYRDGEEESYKRWYLSEVRERYHQLYQ